MQFLYQITSFCVVIQYTVYTNIRHTYVAHKTYVGNVYVHVRFILNITIVTLRVFYNHKMQMSPIEKSICLL